jgi:DNA topoisomerase-1
MSERVPAAPDISPIVAEAASAAKSAGLRYVNVSHLAAGIRRLARGKTFRYVTPDGKPLKDEAELKRVRALAIPPAWTDVWICPSPLGHIQAMGRDAKGRKQYRYHAQWREVRDETKYGQLVGFAKALPAIRRRVQKDLARPGLPREKVLAAVVSLLELTMIRVGNEEYARTNQSFGLTTLRDRHVRMSGHTVQFKFRGKSGKEHALKVVDRRLARIVKACQDLPGQELFQFLDPDGNVWNVDSGDVNTYLREVSGTDLSAKVFRTWSGTVRALTAVRALDPATATKADLVAVVKDVADQLGNTPAVCRKSYIHPGVIESYERGEFHPAIARLAQKPRALRGLSADERLTLAFLGWWQKKKARAPSLKQALARSVARTRKAS